ncbi:helix-turn-helix domain-containing protein [Agreia sp. PsM10]|uniref:helix-turn-helix domain-containing protein n=1 Tax=Agreia sp. PsM10 TaxID=3030533 RepID=UPI00263BC06D|nr:helix-turn-helix domain-containing protein [Agreia sp. PsM10]MDN4639693.1 helix-turn-helix domain-containing protein [Agreia sp. PsM10]
MSSTRYKNEGTLQEGAEIGGVTKQTMRRYISDGKVEAYRFGPRLIRVNLDSVRALGRPLQYIDIAD